MKFALYAQKYKASNKEIISNLLFAIEQRNGEVIFEKNYFDMLIKENVITKSYETFTGHNDLPEDLSFFVSIGGDGTMLRAANFIKSR